MTQILHAESADLLPFVPEAWMYFYMLCMSVSAPMTVLFLWPLSVCLLHYYKRFG